jgi:hypothetical protein
VTDTTIDRVLQAFAELPVDAALEVARHLASLPWERPGSIVLATVGDYVLERLAPARPGVLPTTEADLHEHIAVAVLLGEAHAAIDILDETAPVFCTIRSYLQNVHAVSGECMVCAIPQSL